jgi:hypothetical protein
MIEQQEGGQIWNDGKVGVAYIQELRFALFIIRLQAYLEYTLDVEFKKYLKQSNIHIDETMYRIRLPEPSNFGKYRQLELDTQLLGAYGSADSVQHLSKRFAMKKYLQLTDEELITNERLKAQELGMDPNDTKEILRIVYGTPDAGGGMGGMGGMGGFGGGFGGVPMDMGLDPVGGDMPADGALDAAGGTTGPVPTGTEAPPQPTPAPAGAT